ncbi:MAG: hypothetical protein KAT46_04130 [Deltaproteobacteria bacterium]|nr:hypothetical protein [Deltaproteobacteria bacterium]
MNLKAQLKKIPLQNILVLALLGLLLISRVYVDIVILDILLILMTVSAVLLSLYLRGEKTSSAVIKASNALAKSKYSPQIREAKENADETLAAIIDELALNFRSLTASLEDIVNFSRKVSTTADQISLGTEAQSFSMEETSTSIEGISASIIVLVDMVERLFPNAEKATESILDMVASNKKISLSTQELFNQVKDVSANIETMVNSVDSVKKRFTKLTVSSEDTSRSIKRIDVSIKDINEKAGLSSDLADQVRADAEVGATVTSKTINGMKRIREIVVDSAEVIHRLGEKSGEVGDIINVINDITDRTNLLALNASIIAAQAGEHGKGFAVVADEIKRLADQTAQSTVEIGDIVLGIQGMVNDVIQANEMGKWSAEEGVKLSNEAGEALRKILESTKKSAEMSNLIAASTISQSKETVTVLEAIQSEVAIIHEVDTLIKDDARLSEMISETVKKMVDTTRDVAKSNIEQEKANSEVTKVIEEVKEMIRSMFDITRTQKSDSDQILQAIEIINYISAENISAIKELAGGAGELKNKISEFNTSFEDTGL